jgi:hypothetical protein
VNKEQRHAPKSSKFLAHVFEPGKDGAEIGHQEFNNFLYHTLWIIGEFDGSLRPQAQGRTGVHLQALHLAIPESQDAEVC